jgi:beta-1,4-mannosyltransferase
VATAPIRVMAWPAFAGEGTQPYTAMFSRALAAQGAEVEELSVDRLLRERVDVVHVHWPEFALPRTPLRRPALGTLRILCGLWWAKRRGARIVWTVHNLQPHDQSRLQGFNPWMFWRLFPRAVDAFVTLSRAGVPTILERFPALRDKPHAVVPIGHYRGTYDDAVSRAAARERLGIAPSAPVLLFFGLVRPYKNASALIAAFRDLTHPEARLVVAGPVDDPRLEKEIRAAALEDERVRLHLSFVPNDDVQLFLRAADLVVLPFSQVFNSSSALLALSFDRRVLLPDVPTFRELQAIVGEDWVRLFAGALTADELERALEGAPADDRKPDLDAFEWSTIAARTLDLYRRIR